MSDNNTVADPNSEVVDPAVEVVSKAEFPVVSDVDKAVDHVVTDSSKGVVSEVTGETTPVDPTVSDDVKSEEPTVSDSSKSVDPTTVSDVTKSVDPTVSDDTKSEEPTIADDTKNVEPVVSDDLKSVESVVSDDLKSVESVVSDDSKSVEPVVSDDTKIVETIVMDDTKTVSPAKGNEAVEPTVAESKNTADDVITSDDKDESSYGIEIKCEPVVPESDVELTDDEKAKLIQSEDKSASEDKSLEASLAVEAIDYVSVLSLHGSSESDLTPPPNCFNWFKKYGSPHRFMSKLMHKKDFKVPKPQKSDLPSLDSAVSDEKDPPKEIVLENGAKYYENIFIGTALFIPPQDEIERIDYATLAEEKIIPAYLGAHPCYDVMPTSGKVIILSVELLVKNAFSALVSNDIKAAPLWDAGCFDFVGMLTISDFINVLRHYYYSSPEDIKDIENQSISTWRKITKVDRPFVKVNGSDSLVQATKLLIHEGVHRIPVFDEKRQSVLFVLTRKRLLHFLSNSLFENFEKTNVKTPSFFRKTIRELKVGTYEDIATVEVSTKVIDALDLFAKRKVSSLPVVENDNILVDIFEKFDVFQLAKEQTYHNLDMPIKEAICKADVRETAWICTLDETFGTVINRFVNNKVHRIVVIDDKRAVVGMISLSDVLKFLVLNPLENSGLSSATETIEEGSEGAVGGTSSEPEPGTSLDSTQKADDPTVLEAVENLKIEDSKAE